MGANQDSQIGQNVLRLRGGQTQQAIADAMRDRGWKWSQATVWSVEKGERPLRLSEAFDLGEILDCSVQDLGMPPLELQLVRDLQESEAELRRAYVEACVSIERLFRARAWLEGIARVAAKRPNYVDPEILDGYVDALGRFSLEVALREVDKRLAVVRDPMFDEAERDHVEHREEA